MKKWLIISLIIIAGGGYYAYQDPAARAWLEKQGILPKAATHTTVYRWKDTNGQVQITNTPPPDGIPYKTIEYRKDTNVIPAEKLTGKK